MDRFGPIILLAGLGCFAFAFMLSGLYPYLITEGKDPDVREASIVEVAEHVPSDFRDLKAAYPVAFGAAFPEGAQALTFEQTIGLSADDGRLATSEDSWKAAYAVALRAGRDAYISEVCWHCHSQYVRPVANEAQRFGPVLLPDHDNNALQRPVLWGTRRVGPDLTHEGGKRSNDWHVAHFYDPTATSPDSVMPAFPWFFEQGFQVMRRIDPEKAERSGLDPETAYPMPGLHPTRAAAEQALETLKDGLPETLAGEGERLFVAESEGPNGRALALIAYLQWLGTWTPPHLEDA